jgi:ribosome-binding factor A
VAGRRLERVAEAIREVVSTAILFEMKDPRVQGVTVLRAEVTGDLRNAKIYVSLMGDAAQQKLTLHGLNHARGFIQSKVAARLQTRWTPVIQFVVDESVKKSIEISRLIERAMASGPKPPSTGEPTEPPTVE